MATVVNAGFKPRHQRSHKKTLFRIFHQLIPPIVPNAAIIPVKHLMVSGHYRSVAPSERKPIGGAHLFRGCFQGKEFPLDTSL
jgi:hypothetical protein